MFLVNQCGEMRKTHGVVHRAEVWSLLRCHISHLCQHKMWNYEVGMISFRSKNLKFQYKIPPYTLLCIKIHHMTTDKQFIKLA